MKGAFLAALTVASALFVPTAFAAQTSSPCARVSRSVVGSTLGLSISSTRSIPEPGTPGLTVCYFRTNRTLWP